MLTNVTADWLFASDRIYSGIVYAKEFIFNESYFDAELNTFSYHDVN
jgi:hypothetical protein